MIQHLHDLACVVRGVDQIDVMCALFLQPLDHPNQIFIRYGCAESLAADLIVLAVDTSQGAAGKNTAPEPFFPLMQGSSQ